MCVCVCVCVEGGEGGGNLTDQSAAEEKSRSNVSKANTFSPAQTWRSHVQVKFFDSRALVATCLPGSLFREKGLIQRRKEAFCFTRSVHGQRFTTVTSYNSTRKSAAASCVTEFSRPSSEDVVLDWSFNLFDFDT